MHNQLLFIRSKPVKKLVVCSHKIFSLLETIFAISSLYFTTQLE